MEYEFYSENDQPVARFSMGHEAVGRWFTEELGKDKKLIVDLLDSIQKIESQTIANYRVQGREFQLNLSLDQVEIVSNQFLSEYDEIPEDTNLYEVESNAECALEEFNDALLSWQEFVD